MNISQQIPNFLLQRAFLTPDRVALKYQNIELTFSQLNQQAISLAGKLTYAGIKSGDPVAVLMKNSLDMVILIHALKHIGAITVLMNVKLTSSEIGWQLQHSQAKFFIANDEFLEVQNVIGEINTNICNLQFKQIMSHPEGIFELQKEFYLDNTDTVMYTSGTTGHPKGVKQTYGNHWWSAVGSALNLGLSKDDCWLIAVPLFHISGLSILMRSVIYGIPVIIHDHFDPKKVNQAIMEEGVTIVSVVSAMLTRMIKDLAGKHYPVGFRCMLLGGGPAPKPLLEECKNLAIPVFQTYGLTETSSQIVTLSPEYSLEKIGSAGKPLFPAQIRIEAENTMVDPNIPGEIVVKGPNVTKGYLHNEAATKQAIKDGWLYTGDIGYLDEDGFLYVLDRRSDLIISGGENIYPAEIESVLLSHQSIMEAGVIGLEDVHWGQVPCAFVKIAEDAKITEDEVIQFCMSKLAKYKVPKKVYFVQELPKNASNKLVRRRLVELLPIDEPL